MSLELRIGYRLVIGLVLLLSTQGCKKDEANCFDSRGGQTSEIRAMEGIRGIDLQGRIQTILVQDSAEYIEVEYGSNLLAGIRTKQDGSTLYLSEENSCDWVRKQDPLPIVTIHYVDIDKIYSQSSGSITFQNAYRGDSLKIEIMDVSGNIEIRAECKDLSVLAHTGSTDIAASGVVNSLYVYNSGYAPLHFENVVARFAHVHNNSVGSTYVRAWQTLYYQIHHEGNIYLYGIADVVPWVTKGKGQVFFEGE